MRPDAPASGIAIDRSDGCWTITLDRPDKANALSRGLVDALTAAAGEAEREAARVIVFRGNGRNFSAGFDFGGFEDQSEAELAQRFVRIEMLLQAVARSRCLTVGFAQGRSFGAGVDLFAACKWRVAAPEATFRMPGLAFGVVLGTRRFAALVGTDTARSVLRGSRRSMALRLCKWGSLAAWPRKTNGRRSWRRRWTLHACCRTHHARRSTAPSTATRTMPISPTSCAPSPPPASRTASAPTLGVRLLARRRPPP